ncbi:MAG: hypothetical protein LBC53_08880 [Spirochaetaceae bacterium]|nr:hypothetical protein [Spirochaetaceae bacterium]
MEWKEQMDVLNYELRIERLVQGRWRQEFLELTDKPAMKISLEPGEYRYRIDVIDLLGRRRPPADWARLTVLRALQPEVTSFSPTFFDVNETQDYTLVFNGKSIEQNASVFLISPDGKTIYPDEVSVAPGKNSGKAVFKNDSVVSGYWTLKVVNPGGLEAELSTLAIGSPSTAGTEAGVKTSDMKFMFSEGYSFLKPFMGNFVGFFDEDFYPAGASIRFAYFPFKKKNKLGEVYERKGLAFEIEPIWAWMESSGVYDNANYRVSAHLFAVALNVLYHKKIFNKFMAFNIRAGGGMTFMYDLRVQQEDEKNQWIISREDISGLVPYANFNASLNFIINSVYFIEIGADWRVLLSTDTPPPTYIALLFSFGGFF